MQDNPLVGDYTKGVSKNTVQYFKGLQRRAEREKTSVRGLALDMGNPLFAMLRGPVDPLGLDQNGRVRQVRETVKKVKNVDKSVDKATVKGAKKGWKTVNLADLRAEFAQAKRNASRPK
jgi:hypothetical protein